MTAKISLVIPGLCGPIPEIDENHAAAKNLLRLLKNAHSDNVSAPEYASQLAQLFGIESSDKIPQAAINLKGMGRDPGTACWIHADPVNLQADMDRAILSDSHILNLRMDEAEKLVDEINHHLSEDGLSLQLADENNWFIKLDECRFSTTPLYEAAGHNINHLLPQGDGAGYWKSLLNEIQMLLHMSEVNAAREQRGQAPVNSIWLWGEGCLPGKGDTDITQVYTDDMLAIGLASMNAIPCSNLIQLDELAKCMKGDAHLLVTLDQLMAPSGYGDVAAWHEALGELVDRRLLPLVDFAGQHKVSLDVYPCNGIRYHLLPSKKMKVTNLQFWKKARLQDYVET